MLYVFGHLSDKSSHTSSSFLRCVTDCIEMLAIVQTIFGKKVVYGVKSRLFLKILKKDWDRYLGVLPLIAHLSLFTIRSLTILLKTNSENRESLSHLGLILKKIRIRDWRQWPRIHQERNIRNVDLFSAVSWHRDIVLTTLMHSLR